MRSGILSAAILIHVISYHTAIANPVSQADEITTVDPGDTFDASLDSNINAAVCHDNERSPSTPSTAMSWLRLIAWSKLPLVAGYNSGEYIVCMPDVSPVPDTLRMEKSGVCAKTSTGTITTAQVKRGLNALVESGCRVCGTSGQLEVRWVEDRRGCNGVCERGIHSGEGTVIVA